MGMTPVPHPPYPIHPKQLFLKDFIYFFRERKGGRKRGREASMCGCLSHTPHWGPGLQPRYVPWTGNQTGDPLTHRPALNHWATPARAKYNFFKALKVTDSGRTLEKERPESGETAMQIYTRWVFQVEGPTVQRPWGKSVPGCFQMSKEASAVGAETARIKAIESEIRKLMSIAGWQMEPQKLSLRRGSHCL